MNPLTQQLVVYYVQEKLIKISFEFHATFYKMYTSI